MSLLEGSSIISGIRESVNQATTWEMKNDDCRDIHGCEAKDMILALLICICVMVFQVIAHQSWYGHPSIPSLLLMESIQHSLGCKQNCKRCDKLPISTSLPDFWAINIIKFVPYQLIPKWEIRATSHLLQKWCDLHKASGVLTQGRRAPLQTHRVQMPQKLAEEPRLTRKFGWLGDERKSENHEKTWKTHNIWCVSVCVDVKKPRACWIGLHFPKFPYCKPQSPFYQTRKRGRTTWYKPVFSIKDFKMILQMDYSVRICAYFVWRLESQSWINLWRSVPEV